MEIRKSLNENVLTVTLIGRLDTTTAPELEASLAKESGYAQVIFDFGALEYISSAGLRLLFSARKKLGGADKVIVTNVNDVVREIFRVTGFDRQITVK